ncbi:MAG: hypothetical protein Q8808_02275 [Candidatus Phytoplasma australasiaticum]|nr:hypothetical protein [Candidatus Phytoplasma australasiaticum]
MAAAVVVLLLIPIEKTAVAAVGGVMAMTTRYSESLRESIRIRNRRLRSWRLCF